MGRPLPTHGILPANSNPSCSAVRLGGFIVATTKSNYISENKTIITPPSRHSSPRSTVGLGTARPAAPALTQRVGGARRPLPGRLSRGCASRRPPARGLGPRRPRWCGSCRAETRVTGAKEPDAVWAPAGACGELQSYRLTRGREKGGPHGLAAPAPATWFPRSPPLPQALASSGLLHSVARAPPASRALSILPQDLEGDTGQLGTERASTRGPAPSRSPPPQGPWTAGELLGDVAAPRPLQWLQRVLGFIPDPSQEGEGWMRGLGGSWGGVEAEAAAVQK